MSEDDEDKGHTFWYWYLMFILGIPTGAGAISVIMNSLK